MNEMIFYDTLRQALWVAVAISLPILTVALLTGLVVGLFQALTSVQEMTLTFVPKLGAIVVVFWITMAYMALLHGSGRVASITGQARSTLTRENGQPTDSNLAQPSSVILLRARTPICASVF